MTILIVDDDAVCRLVLRRMLESAQGNRVVEAADGAEAWERLQQGLAPDVCFLDLLMPKMGGLDLLQRLRTDAKLSSLPVIICTTARDGLTIQKAARLHTHYYMLKPLKRELVLAQLARIPVRTEACKPLEELADTCQRLGVTPEFHREMLILLLAEVERVTHDIEGRVRDGDWAAARVEVNGLKGASSTLGAHALVASLNKLEDALLEPPPTSSDTASDTGPRAAMDNQAGLQAVLSCCEEVRLAREQLVEAFASLEARAMVDPAAFDSYSDKRL